MAPVKSKKSAKTGNAAWRNWYKEHRIEFNAARRQKYRTDEELRRRILEQQQEARKLIPKKPRKPPATQSVKNVGGKLVEVYRISKVAEMINRDAQSIRIWEREGKIPKPTIPGGHRYYTEGQVALLKQYSDLMTELRLQPTVRAVEIPKLLSAIKAQWTHA